jgi:hypothetical protein
MTSTSTPTPAPMDSRRLPRSVGATLAIWSALLRLCPRAFRQSHAMEMEQVFRAMLMDAWRAHGLRGIARLWAPALGDLLVGAMAAHGDEIGLSFEALKRSWLMSRMRSSAITIFSAYIALVLTGMGFQKLTEDIMKTSIPTTYPGVRLAYDAIVVGAVIALLAVLVGGLPIAWAAIRQALSDRRWGVLALFAVPPISLAIWLGWTWTILNVIQPAKQAPTNHDPFEIGIGRSWVGLLILAAIVSVAAVSIAVARSPISGERYRFSLRAAIVATLGMFITMAGVAAFGLQIQAIAPQALTALASPLEFGQSTGVNLVVQVIVMLVASIVAAFSVFRGLSAPPARPDGAPALA